MYKINLYERFSYSKTLDFWNIIKRFEREFSNASLDYTVIKRDRVLFQLCYSYGLTPEEVTNLTMFDFNFLNEEKTDASFGSIFISNKNNKQRLVYPLCPEITKEIHEFWEAYNLLLNTPNSKYIFVNIKGNPLTLGYINTRFRLYNSKLPPSKRLNTINILRQYYIADLLRLNGISQSFINNQIGNNITNNQVYGHLYPHTTRIYTSLDF